MDPLASAGLVFLISSVAVIYAGVGLARYGDELAEKTGWGKLWVGTALVSVATSLPELTVNIAAVWLEDAPDLALGNVFGANMINIFVLGLAGLVFGVRNLFGGQGSDTRALVLLGIGLVAVAAIAGASGDADLGPTSLGALAILALYAWGMRRVYQLGRVPAELGDLPAPTGKALKAWILFGTSAAIVIVAARFLASSADDIARLTGISASFIGVLLVAIVTTLPEASVTVAAALRKSYGIVIGNVYGSCAFNVFILFFSDLFYGKGPLLAAMQPEHFVAAAGAFILMGTGYLILRGSTEDKLAWAKKLSWAIPLLYFAALYAVFTLGQR
jgi:cation:H+ antiporter